MTYRIINRQTGKSICSYRNTETVFKLRGDAILYVLDHNLSEHEWKIVEMNYGECGRARKGGKYAKES